jgi:uncharacterized membrane protein HdeD (DUF308 family)
MSTATRVAIIRIAGLLIMLLAVGAALLPGAENIAGRTVVGLLLIAAGLIEFVAVYARRGRHIAAAVAAGASLLAGLRLELDPNVNFLTALNLVILWLVVRAAALFFSARGSPKPLCTWVYLAAAIDFVLAVALLGGVPVAVLVYGLFGEADQIIASFAWVLAFSFVAAGLLLVIAAREQGAQSA